MITITRKFTFDAGHRVLGHEGKCRHLHGHTYTAEVTIIAPDLDDLGRVIDFSVVKKLVGAWIDEKWDHNMILHRDDPLRNLWLDFIEDKGTGHNLRFVRAVFGGREPYVMSNGNPTAENMAKELFDVCAGIFADTDVKPVHVRLWETPNCYADYAPDRPQLPPHSLQTW